MDVVRKVVEVPLRNGALLHEAADVAVHIPSATRPVCQWSTAQERVLLQVVSPLVPQQLEELLPLLPINDAVPRRVQVLEDVRPRLRLQQLLKHLVVRVHKPAPQIQLRVQLMEHLVARYSVALVQVHQLEQLQACLHVEGHPLRVLGVVHQRLLLLPPPHRPRAQERLLPRRRREARQQRPVSFTRQSTGGHEWSRLRRLALLHISRCRRSRRIYNEEV
eukprot:scaffold2114_cov253-Pinguiococcus_pyrenoidosus.AAC.12